MRNDNLILDVSFDAAASAAAIISPVTDNSLEALQERLRASVGGDPYAKSAAYFAMTGRDGLWKVENDNSLVLLCQHPNVEGEILVFPPIGDGGDGLLSQTLNTVAAMGMVARLSRFENPPMHAALNGSEIRVSRIPETALDWAYPVHVLDTAVVSDHRGGGFENLRQHLNRLDISRVNVKDIDPFVDGETVLAAVRAWAGNDASKIAPYLRQLDLFGKLPLAGRLIFYEGKPAGVSIWEETDGQAGMANAYAHLAVHEVDGLSRLVMLDMCEVLAARGFSRVCIGGSETEGLDRFKRKFCPVESVSLSTWRINARPVVQRSATPSTHGQFDVPALIHTGK